MTRQLLGGGLPLTQVQQPALIISAGRDPTLKASMVESLKMKDSPPCRRFPLGGRSKDQQWVPNLGADTLIFFLCMGLDVWALVWYVVYHGYATNDSGCMVSEFRGTSNSEGALPTKSHPVDAGSSTWTPKVLNIMAF